MGFENKNNHSKFNLGLAILALLFCFSSFGVDTFAHHGSMAPGELVTGEVGTLDFRFNVIDMDTGTACGYYKVHHTYNVTKSGFIQFQVDMTSTNANTNGVQAYSDAPDANDNGGFSVACPSCPAINPSVTTYDFLGMNLPSTTLFAEPEVWGTQLNSCTAANDQTLNPKGGSDFSNWMYVNPCPGNTNYNYLITEWGRNYAYNWLDQTWQLIGGYANYSGNQVSIPWEFNSQYGTIDNFSPFAVGGTCGQADSVGGTSETISGGPTGDRNGQMALNSVGVFYMTDTHKVYFGVVQPTAGTVITTPTTMAWVIDGFIKYPGSEDIALYAPQAIQLNATTGKDEIWLYPPNTLSGLGTMSQSYPNFDGSGDFTMNTTRHITVSIDSLNSPRNGFFEASIKNDINAAKGICAYTRGTGSNKKAIILCSGQAPAATNNGRAPFALYLTEAGQGTPDPESPGMVSGGGTFTITQQPAGNPSLLVVSPVSSPWTASVIIKNIGLAQIDLSTTVGAIQFVLVGDTLGIRREQLLRFHL